MPKTSKPLASFVIPVHNGAAYLAETLAACLSQDLKSVEIVVVDDFSSDSTKTVIKHFAFQDKRVVPVWLDQNVGRSTARNEGIRRAVSDILLMCDADDIPILSRAKKTVNFFNDNPDIDVMYGSYWVMDELGRSQGMVEAKPFDYERMKNSPQLWFEIGHSSMAFRRRAFEKVQYTDGEFSRNAIDDWKYQNDAHLAGMKFGNVKTPLYYYRFMPKRRDEEKIYELKKSCIA